MTDDRIEDECVQRFWDAYVASARVGSAEYVVVQFGDGAELADELATQVDAGTRRATTGLLRDAMKSDDSMHESGDLCVVVDGKNAPRCIIKILSVEIKAIRDVDEEFALAEGGGDRSVEWWRAAYVRFFKRRGDREGFFVDDATEVVLERFEVVWPIEQE